MGMIKIKESELKGILKEFNNKSMYVYVNGIISGRNTIHKAKCTYSKVTGTMQIFDKISQDSIKIETFMAYQILLSEDKRILEIKLDNEEDIRIEL